MAHVLAVDASKRCEHRLIIMNTVEQIDAGLA